MNQKQSFYLNMKTGLQYRILGLLFIAYSIYVWSFIFGAYPNPEEYAISKALLNEKNPGPIFGISPIISFILGTILVSHKYKS